MSPRPMIVCLWTPIAAASAGLGGNCWIAGPGNFESEELRDAEAAEEPEKRRWGYDAQACRRNYRHVCGPFFYRMHNQG